MEGKALEAALAGKLPREGVRMKDDSCRWHVIRTPGGKRARAEMLLRAEAVKAELARAGLQVTGGDLLVTMPGGEISVDLLCMHPRGTSLIEVKWTRQSCALALDKGKDKIPLLKSAVQNGRWLHGRRSGNWVDAKLVAAIAVNPYRWVCHLEQAAGKLFQSLESKREVPKKESRWAKCRGKAKPGSKTWPSGSLSGSAKRKLKRYREDADASAKRAHRIHSIICIIALIRIACVPSIMYLLDAPCL